MTLFRATVLDTPDDPFAGGALRSEEDCGLLVEDGVISGPRRLRDAARRAPRRGRPRPARGHGAARAGRHARALPPGAGHRWAGHAAARLARPVRAARGDAAGRRRRGRGRGTGLRHRAWSTPARRPRSCSGRTSRRPSTSMFEAADLWGLRVTTGLVTSDRILPEPLLTTPERAYDESRDLASRWHGKGRLRYAVTPRFSLSASDAILESCAATFREVEGSWFTSHVNENTARDRGGRAACSTGPPTSTPTTGTGWSPRARCWPTTCTRPTPSWPPSPRRDASVAHCPTSNSALGSGLFPLRRHVEAGVRVAMGSRRRCGHRVLDAQGGAAGLLHAAAARRRGPAADLGAPALAVHRRPGADALGLATRSATCRWASSSTRSGCCPRPGDPLAVGLGNAKSADDALSKVFALGTTSDVGGVWVGGDQIAAGRWRMPRRPDLVAVTLLAEKPARGQGAPCPPARNPC